MKIKGSLASRVSALGGKNEPKNSFLNENSEIPLFAPLRPNRLNLVVDLGKRGGA